MLEGKFEEISIEALPASLRPWGKELKRTIERLCATLNDEADNFTRWDDRQREACVNDKHDLATALEKLSKSAKAHIGQDPETVKLFLAQELEKMSEPMRRNMRTMAAVGRAVEMMGDNWRRAVAKELGDGTYTHDGERRGPGAHGRSGSVKA